MKAKSKEQYIEAWTSHINQFIHVCMDVEAPMDTWTELKEDMQALIDVAANKVFPETCQERSGGYVDRDCVREHGHDGNHVDTHGVQWSSK